MTQPNSNSFDYSYFNRAMTGLRGCISRASNPFVDDFGNEIEFWMPDQNRWARSYFFYHTNYITGIGKDDIYIV